MRLPFRIFDHRIAIGKQSIVNQNEITKDENTPIVLDIRCRNPVSDSLQRRRRDGSFGQLRQHPGPRRLVSQLIQIIDATQNSASVTFSTQDAWTATITETRAEAPDWISISPDHGEAAGSYTVQITLQPNTGADPRMAIITIQCGSSQIEIAITQKASAGGDGDQERMPNGRLTRITLYDEGELESITLFAYTEENRLSSVKTYGDETLTEPVETWEFVYQDNNNMTITEKHYDKPPQVYGETWQCEGAFIEGNYSLISLSANQPLGETDPSNYSEYTYEYNSDEQLSTIYGHHVSEGNSSETQEHYVYFSDNCTQIQWDAAGNQTFSYDEDVQKNNSDYRQLFASYPAIDPGLIVTDEPNMLRALGFFGYQGSSLPVTVKTTWSSDVVIQNISYQYNDLSGWNIGEQIDGMEILVQDNIGNDNLRYVLTFEGM